MALYKDQHECLGQCDNYINEKYSSKLESLRQVFIGIKVLYEIAMPPADSELKYNCNIFVFSNMELRKLILGRLCILLFDRKDPKFNTISFKILIEEMLKDNLLCINQVKLGNINESLKNKEGRKYKSFRNKNFAHIELDEDNNLRDIKSYEISNKDVTDLLELAQRSYDDLFLLLFNSSTNHMRQELEEFSKKLWSCFQNAGVVVNKV